MSAAFYAWTLYHDLDYFTLKSLRKAPTSFENSTIPIDSFPYDI